jgi:hypothetical protein
MASGLCLLSAASLWWLPSPPDTPTAISPTVASGSAGAGASVGNSLAAFFNVPSAWSPGGKLLIVLRLLLGLAYEMYMIIFFVHCSIFGENSMLDDVIRSRNY